MRKWNLLFVLAVIFLLGLSKQRLYASDCVDETDQAGGGCTTSRCSVSCDSGDGTLQGKRNEALPSLKKNWAESSQSHAARGQRYWFAPARSTYASSDLRNGLVSFARIRAFVIQLRGPHFENSFEQVWRRGL